MFSFKWIEKVVPQPPVTSETTPITEEEEKEKEKQKKVEDALPGEPKPEPLPQRKSSDGRKTDEMEIKAATVATELKSPDTEQVLEQGPDTEQAMEHDFRKSAAGGVLAWLAQGLVKVIPQPSSCPTPSCTIQDGSTEQKKKDQNGEGLTEKSKNHPEQGTRHPPNSDTGGVSAGKASGHEREECSTEVKHIEPKNEKETEAPRVPITPVPASIPALAAQTPPTSELAAPMQKGAGIGLLSWFMQGFGKVIPQPKEVSTLTKPEDTESVTVCPTEDRVQGV